MSESVAPIVHRFQANLFPVNAYIIETADALVVVDSTLGVSDGRALRARVDSLGKPLAAVIVTHAHPDHYGAITSLLDGLDVPIVAVDGVDDVIRRDDAVKEKILRPMFGAEWAQRRTFPTRRVHDGDVVTLGGATLRVVDLGPGESPHDSMWLLEHRGRIIGAFAGDLAYSRMHAYLADGFHDEWLRNIERARGMLDADTMLYIGHGEPAPAAELLAWQHDYIDTFVRSLRELTSTSSSATPDDAVLTREMSEAMQRFLPGEDLLFLMQLSVPPMRERLTR